MKTKCFIISNDKYRDHIFNFNISEKFNNDDYIQININGRLFPKDYKEHLNIEYFITAPLLD